MSRQKLRKRHVRVDKQAIFRCIALGFEKNKVLKETKISERSYYSCKQDFEAMNELDKTKILAEAKQAYSERIFDHDYWFDWDYLHEKGESQIPIIQKWYDVMIMRNVKSESIVPRIRNFRNICYGVHGRGKRKPRIRENKISPHVFEESDGVEWVLLLKKSKLKGISIARLTIRNFLKYAKGVEPTQISGEKVGYGKNVDEYFRQPELDRIYHVLDNVREAMPELSKSYALKYGMTYEEFQASLKTCVMFMHHSATRANATCHVKAENFEVFEYKGKQAMKVTVHDKGKKGHEKRVKPILAILQKQLENFDIEHKSGRIFPFSVKELREMMRTVYDKAGITREIRQPLHIWRHTFGKDYNRKTNFNTAFCCMVGGWKDEKTFKDCYGAPELKDFIPLALGVPMGREEEREGTSVKDALLFPLHYPT